IAQSRKLMAMLTQLVERLDTPEEILPAVRELGARHVGYGVIEPRQYAAVGTALLRTLRHELGADLSAEAREAWAAAYKMLSEEMRAAGQARQRSA
ncbi:MAG TPA: globin domain-containing protein, partial [Terricaulis sp.]|nr:globin domain-containing protein [Terricaulis sp.]